MKEYTLQQQYDMVKEYPWKLKYIKNPYREIQLLAVQLYAFAMEYIEDSDEEMQIECLKSNYGAFYLIKNPTDKVVGMNEKFHNHLHNKWV